MIMKKINIAELLKDCPKGMELDCAMFEKVQLDYIALGATTYPIKIQTPDGRMGLNEYGCYSNNKGAKCVIFPKGKTTWEGFQRQFKVGDRIRRKGSCKSGLITSIEPENFYKVEYDEGEESLVNVEYADNWELAPNKFDITTLKPFDKVLVRDNNKQLWTVDLFGFYCKTLYQFACVGHYVNHQCIPYESNEHLLGTTNDCEEYYKTWE